MQEYRPSGFNVLPPVIKNLLIINGIFYLATVVLDAKMHIDLTGILGLHYFFSEDFRPYQLVTYMFMHGSFMHIFFNMFALWMFGNTLENFWGAKRFLTYYIRAGIGAALCHYAVVYVQMKPALDVINNYLANPSLQDFQTFLSSDQLKMGTQEAVNHYNELIPKSFSHALATNNLPEALQISKDYMQIYKADILNAPVVIGASGSVFGILLAFGMLFPNTMLYIYFAIPIKAKWFV